MAVGCQSTPETQSTLKMLPAIFIIKFYKRTYEKNNSFSFCMCLLYFQNISTFHQTSVREATLNFITYLFDCRHWRHLNIISQKIKNVSKVSSISIDEISSFAVLIDIVSAAKHNCQHRVNVFGQCRSLCDVIMATNV